MGSGMGMAVPLLGVPTSVLLMKHLVLKKTCDHPSVSGRSNLAYKGIFNHKS